MKFLFWQRQELVFRLLCFALYAKCIPRIHPNKNHLFASLNPHHGRLVLILPGNIIYHPFEKIS